jgi:uncharacterized membrane protein
MNMLALHMEEFVLTIISMGILIGYHFQLYRNLQRYPLKTAVGVTNHARRAWVMSIMDQKKDLLAIQTLRNWTMASTFLASTAVLISLGLVASAFGSDTTAAALNTLSFFGHPNKTLWMIKLLVLAALFFYAFFNFTLSIRYYNHTGLLINVSSELEPSATIDCVTDVLNHGALHYTLGMRGFYLAVPLGLWLFGPAWMLGGAILIVFILHRLDREI